MGGGKQKQKNKGGPGALGLRRLRVEVQKGNLGESSRGVNYGLCVIRRCSYITGLQPVITVISPPIFGLHEIRNDRPPRGSYRVTANLLLTAKTASRRPMATAMTSFSGPESLTKYSKVPLLSFSAFFLC